MKYILRFAAIVISLALMPEAVAQKHFSKIASSSKAATFQTDKAATTASESITLKKNIAAYYDAADNVAANYYIILADKEDAVYNSNDAKIEAADCNILVLDLYASPSSPITLPEGTYTAGDGSAVMTYSSAYSASAYYGSNGEQETFGELSGTVEVKKNTDGTYSITTSNLRGQTLTFNGQISFENTATGSHVYPQINGDVNTTFTGGLAYYHGNLYESNTGNIYINLFDNTFDESTGSMTATGYNLSICAFNTLFGNPAAASVKPGVYQVARNFKSETYFPGMELDYAGMTMIMGTYVKHRKSMGGSDSDYEFAYITGGTITITQNEDDGKYNFVIDCITDAGYKITGTANNIEIPVTDLSDDKPGAIISNLEENVNLDLNYVKTSRIYDMGTENGCRRFLVDIGSPSGKDGNEGDLIRLEFLADEKEAYLPMGTYNVMEQGHLYTNLYEPFKLVQGYFVNGGLTGTRYMHFEEGRYCVMDLLAPAVGGRVSVSKVDDTNYKFVINLTDDAGFTIKGEWTGPIELNYTPSTGIDNAVSDNNAQVVYTNDGYIQLSGVVANCNVYIFATDGRMVYSQTGGTRINVNSLTPGVYVVKAGNEPPVKFIKK